ncbi:hypothetical protein GCM10010985_29340 [Caballeronia grimmiae]|uniref:Uncharacterized protein n=1 Tax=Caballeronia grimmiae TaxID=1071679 RepID=A0ABQ1RKQ5_9BURK|nr:hypothetical protein GCM10010985_29340 [Caballeronia grimmiae]
MFSYLMDDEGEKGRASRHIGRRHESVSLMRECESFAFKDDRKRRVETQEGFVSGSAI